jgi:6-phosphogluconate dehydrogenase
MWLNSPSRLRDRKAAIEEAVSAVITAAMFARFRSRQDHTFGEKLISAKRFGFGGHVEGQEAINPEAKPRSQHSSAAEGAVG